MSGSHLSKDFFELVKAIGESKSKQEEDRIIVQEVALLKRRMQDGTTTAGGNTKKRQKEFLIRLIYVEMLGHDASFGYIKAVECTASSNLLQKRTGYLCCSLTLSPGNDFRMMTINQLQRDFQSSNHLEVCAALMAICKLVTVEMIPAVLPMVVDLLRHDSELVRKKAVMALHRFHQLNPDSVEGIGDKLRRTLCDTDPSVMGAALCILHDVTVKNVAEYKDLVPSFVSILKQIMEHRLPREFDHHRIPAPWIQIRLLKILAVLGSADQAASEGMYEVLHDVMRRADTGINIGYAILYEGVRTVTAIYPNSTLLDSAADSISRFIKSDNHNLKYLGVTGLAAIVKDHPRYANQHQMAVIDCLEDPDETLKRKTLDLLYRMTNPVNVEFIIEKLTQFLRETNDTYLRTELVSRITQCAERYAPSNTWYIETMTTVFALGGDLVRSEVAHNLLRLIAEGSGEDEDVDMELRRDAVETYLELLDRAVLPDILVTVMAWILGEYGYLSESMALEELLERLVELADRPFHDQDTTRSYILSAVLKITAQLGHVLPSVRALIQKYRHSRSTDLQQRCFEAEALLMDLNFMRRVLPEDASCEDLDVDPNLEFLQPFVDQALASGKGRYDPPEDDYSDDEGGRRKNGSNTLNFAAYEKPEIPYNVPKAGPVQEQWNADPNTRGPPQAPAPGKVQKSQVKQVWGPAGTQKIEEPPAAVPAQGGYPQQGGGGAYPPQQQSAYPPQQQGAYPPQQQGGYPSQQQSGYPQTQGGGYPPPGGHGYPDSQAPQVSGQGYDDNDDNDQPSDERQQMASALFGGIPGASKVSRPARRSSGPRASGSRVAVPRRSKTAEAPVAVVAPSAPAPAIDLLDMGFDSAPAPAPVVASDPFNMSGLDPSANGKLLNFFLLPLIL